MVVGVETVKLIPHDHKTYVEWCFRCDLGRDEDIRMGNKNWETPFEFFEAVVKSTGLNFTLDAAATEDNALVDNFYTLEMNSFDQNPENEIIWCNPPYQFLELWIDLFRKWAGDGNNIVAALLPASTDTKWFYSLQNIPEVHEIRLIHPRINFVGTKTGNRGGNILVIFTPYGRKCYLYRDDSCYHEILWSWKWK